MHLFKNLLLIIVILIPPNLLQNLKSILILNQDLNFESQKILIIDLKNFNQKNKLRKFSKDKIGLKISQ
jgi:hypothetical protein